VYVGHAAVALALKSRDPRVPIVPLVLACYGPDWLELVLGFWHGRGPMSLYTHYLPGLLAGALGASALYVIAFRRHGGWVILAGWLLHWPADFFTAHKGLLSPTDRIGLDLYNLPAADFALEAALALLCVGLYARTFAHSRGQRRWAALMAAALLALQAMLDYGLAQGRPVWNPSLAAAQWRPHLPNRPSAGADRTLRMPLALSPATLTASARWARTECGA
jgi:hypothetical protein